MSERLDVREAAHGRWPSILSALGLDERALSGRHGPCPMCGGKDRFRFDDKEGRGTYFCSGCGAGDGVQLAMGVTGRQFRDVALQIKRLAGVVDPSPKRRDRSDRDKVEALRRAFRGSRALQRDDDVCRYLTGRGLKLHDLPSALRFHPGMTYREGGAVLGNYPAMLATVTDPTGRAVSLHRTYLENCEKASLSVPKKLMQGYPLAGGAIRLTDVSQSLGISEGIETAIAAFELFEVPVWSCISAAGVESFEPPAGVEHVIVFGDNDGNYTGQSAAYRCAHRLTLKGYEVEVHIPPSVGDWLDVLNQRAK